MSELQNTLAANTLEQNKANLLSMYFRQPKIFVKLPSQGQFYPDGALDKSTTGEYPVYAMTAKDELILKTPDALLNGQATVELIKSCVPAIKDPWKMPSIDVDAVLMSIRVASFGKDMEVGANCPACANENEYVFDIVEYLNKIQSFQYNSSLNIGPLKINIKPYNYYETTKTALKAIEQQRIISTVTDEALSDEEKLEKFGKSFLKLTELTVDIVCGCISSIETPEGVVDDKAQIMEFINNTTSEIFNTINDHVTAMKESIEMRSQTVSCQKCEHKFDVAITMDQSNFFAVRS
jgi:hypothetical protein